MSEMNDGHRLEEVIAYEEGFLTDDESAELEVHIRCCKDCQETLANVTSCLPEMYPEQLSMLARQDSFGALAWGWKWR